MMRGMTKTELNIITKSKTQYAMYRYIKNMFPDEGNEIHPTGVTTNL